MAKRQDKRRRTSLSRSQARRGKTTHSRRLAQLHRDATVVDAHSDYALQVLRERLRGKNLVIENQHLPKLQAGGVNVEVLTVGGDFVLDGIDFRDPRNVFRVLDCVHNELEESPAHLGLILHGKDLDNFEPKGRIGLILALEGGAAIADDFSLLRNYYRLGLRSLILTHNERNFLADGCGETPAGGLSKLGKQLIKKINKLDMIVDLVHLGEPGFFEVLELTDKPVIVSHSNARKLCDHFRNLTDNQIKAIARCKGVIGLNFLCFMVDADMGKATLDRFLDHVDYIADLVGIEHVGLGPDFADYYMDVLEEWLMLHGSPIELAKYVDGVEDVSGLPKITEGLSARGYTDQEIRQVLGRNFVRVYKEVLS